MADLERFDPALLGVAQQISAAAAAGDNPIDTLLDIYFGFLRRKTDFFRRVAACCQLALGGARRSACGAASAACGASRSRAAAGALAPREAAAARSVPRAASCVHRSCGARVRRRAASRRACFGESTEALAG